MAHSRRGFVRDRGPRRQTSWEQGPGSITGVDQEFTSDASAIIGNGVNPLIPGLTIVRIRGEMLVSLKSVTAALEGYLVALGIGMVSADAFAIGITAVPTPLSDPEWGGWMWHDIIHVFAPTATGVAEAGAAVTARVKIDSKAMRKFGGNEVLYIAAEADETGTAVMNVYGLTRLLVKLP